MKQESGLTPLGKVLSTLMVAALIGVGIFVFKKKSADPAQDRPAASQNQPGHTEAAEEGFSETLTGPPTLSPPEPYRMKDNVLDVDVSEYAGYAGLLAANGGKEPSENSVFFKNHGFKVRVKFSEEESWNALNGGKVGVSVTTTDVLAVLGKQFQVTCPMLIGYSRGADGIVVQKDIKRLNSLQGRVLVSVQFTEADFFIRYLAQEAGISVNTLADLNANPAPDKINLVYAEDGFTTGDLFLKDLAGAGKLAGCVTWAPKTSQVVDRSGGKARLLTSNRNLLIVSDILVANKAFAQESPKVIAGLVEGWLEGNRLVRDNPEANLALVGKSFGWDSAKTREELGKVHLANLPENLAYFSGAIDAAGSFGGIYQSAVLAYGSLIPDAPPYERFVDTTTLQALQQAGKFAEQKISLSPIKSGSGSALENDPLLTKDIRFFFEPNSPKFIAAVDSAEGKANAAAMADVSRLLRVSPGSVLLLVGHVDDAKVKEFQAQGPQVLQQMKLRAIQLSKDRADSVKSALAEAQRIDSTRLQTDGKGWDRPASKTNPDLNRRVEVQWFTVE